MPWTSSKIFRTLKSQFCLLKDERHTVLCLVLRAVAIEINLLETPFSSDELRAVIGLLAGPVVWQLEFGGDFILLQPERINSPVRR